MADRIQIRRDTAANFTEANPVLAQGEPALEIDTKKEKIGDGTTAWNDLAYRFTGGAGGSENEIIVTEASQLVNQELQSGKVYLIDRQITLGENESIIVPSGGLTMKGFGFNISSLFTSQVNATIFTSPEGGSGDLVLGELSVTNTGTGSKVFDITDSNGQHAIEIEYVNFSGCKSLGKQTGYRQGTWTTVGVYGCADGLELAGTFTGYKVSNTNIFGFGAAGKLFKAGTDLLFSNRFFLNINIDFPTGAVLCDFDEDNFEAKELFQINASIAKVNGEFNIENANALLPNITANNAKSRFVGNIGIPDTALEGVVEKLDVAGTYEVDWFNDTFFLEMTADTVFSEINLPASGKNSQGILLYLNPKAFVATLVPAWLVNVVGSLKANEVNEISVKYLKAGVYFTKISNSLSVYPAPSLQSLDPVSLLPSATAELIINGSFFTPATIVTIEGQTVNSVEFVNQGQLILSVTTGATEGEFDITINNGTAVTFVDALIVNLGTVYIPTVAEFTTTGNINVTEVGNVKLDIDNTLGTATWSRDIDFSKDIIIRTFIKRSNISTDQLNTGLLSLNFIDQITSDVLGFGFRRRDDNSHWLRDTANYVLGPTNRGIVSTTIGGEVELRWISGTKTMLFYINGSLVYTDSTSYDTNNIQRIEFRVLTQLDILNIKYIELP